MICILKGVDIGIVYDFSVKCLNVVRHASYTDGLGFRRIQRLY